MIFRQIILYSLFLVSITLHAEEKSFDFNQQIEDLKKAKSVSLTLRVPKTRGMPYEWIKDHPKYECAVTHSEPRKIEALVDMLKDSLVKNGQSVHLSTINTEIYFLLSGGDEGKILLSETHTQAETLDGKWVEGHYMAGKFNLPEHDKRMVFNATVDLYDRLRNWAKGGTRTISVSRIDELIPDRNDVQARKNYREWLLQSCELWLDN